MYPINVEHLVLKALVSVVLLQCCAIGHRQRYSPPNQTRCSRLMPRTEGKVELLSTFTLAHCYCVNSIDSKAGL